MEFNMLTGIGGEVASSSGLYGFRLLDLVSFGAVGLLAFYSLIPRHILSVFLYALIVAILFSPQLLSYDPQTTTLAYRYMLYSLAALYVVMVIDEVPALEWLCWGLIVGLVATVPIFVVQEFCVLLKVDRLGFDAPLCPSGILGCWFCALFGTHDPSQ